MTSEEFLKRVARPAVFLLCLFPAVLLTYDFFTGGLSFNPIDDVIDISGRWTLRFLLMTIAITPLRRVSGFTPLTRFRRMIGLYAFFYSMIHVSMHAIFSFGLDVGALLRDIPQRPFITAGFVAWITMLPLAVTSTTGWIRRLGGRRWQLLHRLVYATAVAGVIHYFWNYKVTEPGPVLYIALAVLLLGFRVIHRFRGRWRQSPARAA